MAKTGRQDLPLAAALLIGREAFVQAHTLQVADIRDNLTEHR